MKCNSSGDRIYCADRLDSTVSAIYAPWNVVTTTIKLGGPPRFMTYDPSHNRTFVAVGSYAPCIAVLRDTLNNIGEYVGPRADGRALVARPVVSRGVLDVRLAAALGRPQTLHVFDISGREVKRVRISSKDLGPAGTATVDLRSLPAGVCCLAAGEALSERQRIVILH